MQSSILHDNINEKKITEIDDICDELVDSIETFTLKYKNELGDAKVRVWQAMIDDVELKTRSYAKEILDKDADIRASNSSYVPLPSTPSSTRLNTSDTQKLDQARTAKIKVENVVDNIEEDELVR